MKDKIVKKTIKTFASPLNSSRSALQERIARIQMLNREAGLTRPRSEVEEEMKIKYTGYKE